VDGPIHPEFLRLLCVLATFCRVAIFKFESKELELELELLVLADKQTRDYYALIGAEEEIGIEAFTWSRARTFSFNKISIGKVFAYATATRLHRSVNGTVPLSPRQPTCIEPRRTLPLTPSPRYQRGCWCTQRHAICS